MSRIGNKVINLPAGVTCTVAADNTAVVKGPKGELSFKFNSEIKIVVEETTITLTRPNDNVKALHGTSRAVLANMVKGLYGILSDETLISILPFIENSNEEIEKRNKEKESTLDYQELGVEYEA